MEKNKRAKFVQSGPGNIDHVTPSWLSEHNENAVLGSPPPLLFHRQTAGDARQQRLAKWIQERRIKPSQTKEEKKTTNKTNGRAVGRSWKSRLQQRPTPNASHWVRGVPANQKQVGAGLSWEKNNNKKMQSVHNVKVCTRELANS